MQIEPQNDDTEMDRPAVYPRLPGAAWANSASHTFSAINVRMI